MKKGYNNFSELDKAEVRGKDFDIKKSNKNSRYVVIAIHGGKIEQGTDKIARRIAGKDLSFYFFLGKKSKGNRNLHIISENFDEPECLELVKNHWKVISIHGEKSKNSEFVMVGGLDNKLRNKISKHLKQEEFVITKPLEHLRGINPRNICNQCNSGEGIQIEISKNLRSRLNSDEILMKKFSNAVRLSF